MTDNRTTELREKLTERGVEYTTNDSERIKETRWPYMGELMAEFTEYSDGTTHFECDTWCFTPKQAIAATLGEKPRDRTDERLLKACNQATQDYVKALEELVRDMWHTLSAMYQLNLGINIGKEHDYEQRIAALGIEVIDE